MNFLGHSRIADGSAKNISVIVVRMSAFAHQILRPVILVSAPLTTFDTTGHHPVEEFSVVARGVFQPRRHRPASGRSDPQGAEQPKATRARQVAP